MGLADPHDRGRDDLAAAVAYDTRGHRFVVTGYGHDVSRQGLGETPAKPTTWREIEALYR